MLEGRHFVIAGLSRLTVRLSEALVERGAAVTVVGDPDEDGEDRTIVSLLPDAIRLVVPGRDRDAALIDAGLPTAAGMLALADDDLGNLRYVADAHELAPDVPVVLRTFQPELADHLAESLNIRRAYSVAGLAAPAFVAASFEQEVIETLRLGDDEVPLCVLDIHPGSPLVGLDFDEVKAEARCAVVAVNPGRAGWDAAAGAARLASGDRILVGGRHGDVLRLAVSNQRSDQARRARRRRTRRWRPQRLSATLLPVSAAVFAVVLLATALVNRAAFDLDLTDSIAYAVNAGLGSTISSGGMEWVQVFNILATVTATVLLWIVFSHITALVLAERLEARMTKRAGRLHDHVVVVGLGKVGYRVVQLLEELGVPTVAIEESPDSRFVDAVALHTPVLTGDGQLSENLERCAVDRARCIIACTNNDLANLASCLEARNLNPEIRTVTRVFDEQLATRLGKAFRVDVALSSTGIAASAFLGAATDVLAMRPVDLEGVDLLAFRFSPTTPLAIDSLREWRIEGLRLIAVQRHDGTVEAPTAAFDQPLVPGDEAIVVGPSEVVRRFARAASRAQA